MHSNALLFELMQSQGTHLVVIDDPKDTQALVQQAAALDPQQKRLIFFPDWQTLPYDTTLPASNVIATRLKALHQLAQPRNRIVIIPFHALIMHTPPPEFIHGHHFQLRQNQEYSLEQLKSQLRLSNYSESSLVTEPGTYSVRGSLIDVFINGLKKPIRIDFFDDTIESLHTFSPKTQLSQEAIESIECLPGSEYDLSLESIALFRSHWRSSMDTTNHRLYKSVTKGHNLPELIQYMPFFHDKASSIFDFLPQDTLCHFIGKNPIEACREHDKLIEDRYRDARYRIDLLPIPPSSLYLNADQLEKTLTSFTCHAYNCLERPQSKLDLANEISSKKTVVAIQSQARQQLLIQQLKGKNFDTCEDWHGAVQSQAPISIVAINMAVGFHHPKLRLVVENDCFEQSKLPQNSNDSDETTETPIHEMTEGDLIVHVEHGIGIYKGLETVTVNQLAQEFVVIHYHNQDKLYLPIAQLRLIQPYLGLNPELVELDTLGSGKWLKKRKKAEKKIEDIAAKLLLVYAERAKRKGISHTIAAEEQHSFYATCDFDLTPDQEKATQTILQDLKASKPMERLLCADVGFGKTEVAMRACFAVATGGHQIIVLVPTTLLAEQHYRSFSERFHNFPIQVSLLTRHNSNKQRHALLDDWDKGKTTILITTHIILNQTIATDHLGLVVIDEEHRFGVKQKEKLKSLKAEVDILSLTATPIPRTLHLSLSGLKDISLIQTPPKIRIPPISFVHRQQDKLIQEALSRELLRGGQAFYLHNRVSTIEMTAQHLQSLLPNARIAVIHGQMAEQSAETMMLDFIQHRYDILVCTTIIESGIDIPNANTIIIERADKLGLAQLHQIRGRVGRSDRQAYAYFLTPNEGDIAKDAQRRLKAIERASTLGAGYQIASEDLDIRGTGEILGDEQSGHAGMIGLNLYHELLEEAIQSESDESPLKKSSHALTDIELPVTTAIPTDYMPSPMLRLEFYRKVQACDDQTALFDLREQMRDRFGPLPEPCTMLFQVRRYQNQCQTLGIKKIKGNRKAITIYLDPKASINTDQLIHLIQNESQHYQLIHQTQLRCLLGDGSLNHSICRCLDYVLKALTLEK